MDKARYIARNIIAIALTLALLGFLVHLTATNVLAERVLSTVGILCLVLVFGAVVGYLIIGEE